MGRKRFSSEQIIVKLREAEILNLKVCPRLRQQTNWVWVDPVIYTRFRIQFS